MIKIQIMGRDADSFIGQGTGDTPSDFLMQSSDFCKVCVWRKSVVFFLTFQPLSIRKQILRESLFEDFPQENEQVFLICVSDRYLFSDVYCGNSGHHAIFTSLQERCRRNN